MTANLLYFLSTLFTGAIAGLFYAYSCSVNSGLGKLTDIEYIRSMQEINRAILNIWFLLPFFGAVPVLGGATWLSFSDGNEAAGWLIVVSLLIYLIGVLGVTLGGNVPLNEALDTLEPDVLSAADLTRERKNFEVPWNRWNLIRTIASAISFVLMTLALFFLRSSFSG